MRLDAVRPPPSPQSPVPVPAAGTPGQLRMPPIPIRLEARLKCSANAATLQAMRKDAVYRMRVPRKTLAAIKRVAAANGEDASEWGRAIIETELRRDLAAIQLRDQLRAAKPGSLTEDEALDLVSEAKRATRAR